MEIQAAVKLVKMATGKNSPIYESIAIIENGEKMTAFNGAIRIIVDVDGMTGIECAVDGAKFANAISKYKAPVFEKSQDQIVIKEGRSRVTIPTQQADALPLPQIMEAGDIAPAGIIAAIQAVAFAAGDNDVRAYLNGVNIESKDDDAFAVATNGHMMAYVKVDGGGSFKPEIVPSSAISAISAINPDRITIGGKVFFDGDDCRLIVTPIDGKYPDWRRVIPANPFIMKVSRAEFLDALGKVSVVSNDKMQPATMSIEKGSLTISTRHSDSSEAQAMVDCEATESREIGVNLRYLIDAANAIKADTLTIEYGEPASALLFSDPSISVVVMPMRI